MGDILQQDPQRPVFRADTAAVMVDVSVKTRSGRVITGLDVADFVLEDNGVPQEIATVSYGKLPIDVTVALDTSHSVTGPLLEELRRAVRQLVRDLHDGDRLKLLLFNTRMTRTVDFTTDLAAIEHALRDVVAGGGTALFDTLSVALVSPAPAERRQLVVCFSDGRDSSSATSPSTLDRIIERTRATVSFVVMSRVSTRPSLSSTSTITQASMPIDPAVQRVATATGGTVLPAAMSDLSTAFLRALDAFRSTYVLHYSPKGVDRGGFHTIGVRVGRSDAVVQARRGYFGG